VELDALAEKVGRGGEGRLTVSEHPQDDLARAMEATRDMIVKELEARLAEGEKLFKLLKPEQSAYWVEQDRLEAEGKTPEGIEDLISTALRSP
jgi:hypothetical protein